MMMMMTLSKRLVGVDDDNAVHEVGDDDDNAVHMVGVDDDNVHMVDDDDDTVHEVGGQILVWAGLDAWTGLASFEFLLHTI